MKKIGRPHNEYIGQIMGCWTVLEALEIEGRRRHFLCTCKCGITRPVHVRTLRRKPKTCPRCRSAQDLTGKVFGEWTVLSRYKGKGVDWNCRCSCGAEKRVSAQRLLGGRSTRCNTCFYYSGKDMPKVGDKFGDLIVKSVTNKNGKTGNKYTCVCSNCNIVIDKRYKYLSDHIGRRGCTYCKLNDGFEDIRISYFNTLKKGAEIRNLEFDITIEDIYNQYIKQNKKCALTGQDIKFVRKKGVLKKLQTASVDRIDSSKGYVKDNIQIIHKELQKMKNNYIQTNFINNCFLIVCENKALLTTEQIKLLQEI